MHVLNLTNAETTFFKDQVRALEREGVRCSTMMVPGRKGRADIRSVTDYLRFWPRAYSGVDDRYDLVHANFGLMGPMALTQSRLPVVMSLWGTDLYGPFGWVSKACAPFCDAVVVMSEEMAAEFDRDCDVIPHGVDLNRFQPAPREQARQAVGWNEDDYYVLFPYRPGREVKNYPLAERVVGAVDDIRSQNVRIETVSGAPQDRFIQYLNAADCMLLTSNREGSPNVVKEALACNLPVVSVDVGDVSERLDGVEPSVVCDSEAALVGAVHDVLRQQERSNGREHVQTLSLERMGRQLRSVYERVLDEQSVPKVSSQETK